MQISADVQTFSLRTLFVYNMEAALKMETRKSATAFPVIFQTTAFSNESHFPSLKAPSDPLHTNVQTNVFLSQRRPTR